MYGLALWSIEWVNEENKKELDKMAFASSNVIDFNYDTEQQKLTVYFLGGGKHVFNGVPYGKYADLLAAKSKGKYFAENIKEIYKSEKIY